MAPLASVADLETYLGHPVDPDQAALVLEGISDAVRAWCGWSISEETVTFIRDGTGTWLLTLPTLHVSAVSAVRLRGTLLDPAADAADMQGYSWSYAGLVYRCAGWPAEARAIEVDATHGYDPVPAGVQMVVLAGASRQLANPLGVRSAVVGTVERVWETTGADGSGASGPASLDAALLGPYRIHNRP